jgi:hypothetical protein
MISTWLSTDSVHKMVSTHTVGIDKIIAMYDDLPNQSTIRLWRLRHVYFSTKYLEAKRLQSDLMVEEIDDLICDVNYYHDSEGNQRIDAPSVSLAIARANNRKWIASRLLPKLYGDRHSDEQQTQDLAKDVAARVAEINKQAEKDY